MASRFWFSNEGYLSIAGGLGETATAPTSPIDLRGGWMQIKTNNNVVSPPTIGAGYAGLWASNEAGVAVLYVGNENGWTRLGP